MLLAFALCCGVLYSVRAAAPSACTSGAPAIAPVAPLHCVHGDILIHKCFCDPGYTGSDCSVPSPEPVTPCSNRSDMCFKSDTGVCKVSLERWKRAQEAEAALWAGKLSKGDRQGDHLNGFARYQAVPDQLGKVLEVGCGPWTQFAFLLDTRDSWTIDSITLWEPGAEAYISGVPTCAYRDGKLRGRPVKVVALGAEHIDGIEAYDTIMMINVLEHVQNLYIILGKIHAALKPGGLFIFNDRWWDGYNFSTPVGRDAYWHKDHLYHPIRCFKSVFEHFLADFTPLYRVDDHPAITRHHGHGTYFIGTKNSNRTATAQLYKCGKVASPTLNRQRRCT